MSFVVHGNFVHTVDRKLQILEDSYMLVVDGKIASISSEKPSGDYEVVETEKQQLILPGFVDTHIHAPQYVFAGCGLDLPLLEWLNKYTFPAETKFSSMEHAQRVYEALLQKTVAHGTTTACYFATIWTESSKLLAKLCQEHGQRAFVGKVSMDRNSPPTYCEETSAAIKSAQEFVEEFPETEFVKPIITPRFVPTCTSELMNSLSDIQKKHPDLLIQSHVDENLGEIAWVKELHPESASYTAAYDDHGLLGHNTILAHACHMTDIELDLMAERGASIAHCPSSNFQLYSGALDVRNAQAHNVTVGLGTDVAGGPSPSMIDSMRNALICSRTILFLKRQKGEEYTPLTVPEVLALATEEGAKALGLGDKIGNFIVGKDFDAVIADPSRGAGDVFGEESISDLLEKFVQRGDDRNIAKVFVKGKCIKQ